VDCVIMLMWCLQLLRSFCSCSATDGDCCDDRAVVAVAAGAETHLKQYAICCALCNCTAIYCAAVSSTVSQHVRL
jgi:hypothetical protein